MEYSNQLRHRCSTVEINKEKYKDDALWSVTADEQVGLTPLILAAKISVKIY